MAHRLFHRAFAGIGLIGMLAALASAPVLAQQAAPAQAQQPVAPAAPATPPLPPVPPAQLALARQVMVASGIAESFEPIAGNIALQLLRAYTQKRPANAKDFEDILLGMKPELDAKKNDLINQAAEAYARQIDENSLKGILAFFAESGRHEIQVGLAAGAQRCLDGDRHLDEGSRDANGGACRRGDEEARCRPRPLSGARRGISDLPLTLPLRLQA